MKRFCVLTLFTFFTISMLSAFGRRETEEREIVKMDSWKENFDISSKKAGKYNIVVTATDIGGNVSLSGPFNIFIDPDSDLPITGITNPLDEMTVPGNLNIVGTCIDDDAIDRVELILDNDFETPLIAEGKEFWSYYLDTTGLVEGKHSIDVYGIDINGVKGLSKRVFWHLNRRFPQTGIGSHSMGVLVSGKQKLQGTISDGNGIQKFYYSVDGGKVFEEVKFSNDSKTLESKFDLTIDTTKIPDGPQVCWFKAIDGQNSVGLYSFLFFVDNTKPEVRIIWPKLDDPVNGRFSIAGIATDIIGLKSVTWEFGDQKGELELIPGNPYWIADLDVRNKSMRSAELRIVAEDTVGNISRTSRKIQIDSKLDNATVSLIDPKPDTMVEGNLLIKGIAKDDDGIAEIHYIIDDGVETVLETDGVFFDDATVRMGKPLANGKHTLKIWAKDIDDIVGETTEVEFVVAGAAPQIAINGIYNGRKAPENLVQYSAGIAVNSEANPILSTNIITDSGLSSLTWKFAGMEQQNYLMRSPEKGTIALDIPFTQTQWGVTELVITAIDIYERKTEQYFMFYVDNLTKTHGTLDAELAEIPAATEGTEIAPSQRVYFESVDGVPYIPGMPVVVSPSETVSKFILAVVESDVPVTAFTFAFNNEKPSKTAVRKIGETNRYEADIPIEFMPVAMTNFSAVAVLGKTGQLTAKGAISVIREKASSDINDDKKLYWRAIRESEYNFYEIQKAIPLEGYANFQSPVAVEFDKPTDGLSVTIENNLVRVFAEKEGEYKNVSLKITDGNGDVSISEPINIRADFDGPIIELLEPTKAIWVQKSVHISGLVTEAQKITRSDYSVDGGFSWNSIVLDEKNALEGKIPFDQTIDVSMCADGIVMVDILMEDASKKRNVVHCVLHKDTTAPQISVILPESEETVNGETRIVFNVRDDGRLVKGEYIRADGGAGIDRAKIEKPAPIEEIVKTPVFNPDGTPQLNPDGTPVVTETVVTKEPEVPEVPKDEVEIGETGHFELYLTPLVNTMIGTPLKPLADDMIFEFTDIAGNVSKINAWDFHVDAESDKPVAEIHVPALNEIIQTDFVISGVVYDDDGNSKIWYRLDNEPFASLDEYGSSFSISVPISKLTDNEHTVTVYAEDIHGVKGDDVVRMFKVSLEEPKGQVLTPTIDTTVKGLAHVTGSASDKNGIDKVQISFDNGNTYNDVMGAEDWEYEFDTHIIQDGTHVVFIKVWDKYGIQGLYSSLINIDNTKPQINLELPLDDSKVTNSLFFSGQTTDNIGLKRLYLSIRNLDLKQANVPKELKTIELTPDAIITKDVDISSLDDGFYNIEVTGEDAGGNVTRVSRNIELNKSQVATEVNILYPLNGEHVQGMFNLYGSVISEKPVDSLFLFIDGAEAGMAEISSTGYYRFTITPEQLGSGSHTFVVRAMIDGSQIVSSSERYIIYTPGGPWVTIDNFSMGDFAIDRPYLDGSAGYAFTETELIKLRAKETPKVEREELLAKKVEKIELSFDNGKTFELVSESKKWRYRVENGDMPQGYHFLIVRATMENGETAVTKTIVQIDKTAPFIRLISPGEGGRFNERLEFSGLASDDVALKSVSLALRSGDKSSYAVPTFIQGLYFDWHFWGATLYDIGLGLTFFDDNVKLQFQFGQFTQQQYNMMEDVFGYSLTKMRYGGNVFGLKLLANIAYVPFRYFLGPNWEWLSANFAIGANFSRFDESQSGKPQVLSAVLAQIEFPRITIPKQKMFRTFSFYTEVQCWFIPTDVDSLVDIDSVVPQISGGIRLNVF